MEKVVCNQCGAEYEDKESMELAKKWIEEGYAPCPNLSCPGEMELRKIMTAEEVVKTLMRLARLDSGLPEADRDALFAAHCFCYAQWDLLEASLKKAQEN